MTSLRDYSIKVKLTLMIMATSIVVLTIACSVFVFNDRASFKDRMVSDLSILGQVVATNSASALSFDDDKAASEVLGALAVNPHIRYSAILKTDGKLFASYTKDNAKETIAPGTSFTPGDYFFDDHLDVIKEIKAQNKPLGILVMRSDLNLISERTRWFVGIGIIIGALSLLISWGIAATGQRVISKPIVQLAKTADAIAIGDINQKVDYESKDEIGKLYGSFRNIIEYMHDLSAASEQIAAKNLTVTVNPKSQHDILSHSFKKMVGNLSAMIQELKNHINEMASAASQITASSKQMTKGAKNQAEQVTCVSAAMEEISATIVESVKNASEANQASKNTSQIAADGGQLVRDTIHGMQRINEVVRESSDTISRLANSSEQIGRIVNVINDIADQTNLLALNAAIEAARAGESGRGFAVVADEIRKLAERTGKATEEIVGMVRGIQKETTEAVTSMKTGIQEVDRGKNLADKAGDSLQEIERMTCRVMLMIQQMALASEEQSQAAEKITKNVEDISSVTQETANGAEESAASATQLQNQAESLRKMVEQFQVNT